MIHIKALTSKVNKWLKLLNINLVVDIVLISVKLNTVPQFTGLVSIMLWVGPKVMSCLKRSLILSWVWVFYNMLDPYWIGSQWTRIHSNQLDWITMDQNPFKSLSCFHCQFRDVNRSGSREKWAATTCPTCLYQSNAGFLKKALIFTYNRCNWM